MTKKSYLFKTKSMKGKLKCSIKKKIVPKKLQKDKKDFKIHLFLSWRAKLSNLKEKLMSYLN